MHWDVELISWLENAPFPLTLDELIDYAEREGAPEEVIENLEMARKKNRPLYNSLVDVWPELPTKDDYADYQSE